MLAWLEGTIIKYVLDWLWGKISGAIAAARKDQTNHDNAVKESQSQVEPLKKVEQKDDATESEIDDAIDQASRHF